jgi:glycosyltransferase involved in cell wall biosynthesis
MVGEVAHGPELWRLYLQSDAFLHVSLTEGVPQVLFEAMAAGLPIVATDVGGVAHALADGERGVLVPPRDHRAAADALALLACDAGLREKLVRSALEYAADHTMDRELERIAAFLRSAASIR